MANLHSVVPNETRFRWRLTKYRGQVVSAYTRTMLFSATALVLSGYTVNVFAAPTGGQIVQGTGTISQNGNTTVVSQSTPTLVINWQTYSTLPNETINYLQSSTSWIAINNVLGGQMSVLQGTINALGSVAIFNAAGIINSGNINVGALVASTAPDWKFDGNKFTFSNGTNYASIANSGNINISEGGFAVLAAPYVQNTGVVTANLGTVQLASATTYTLDLRGDGRITFTVDKAAMDKIAADGKKIGVDNSGTLQARSGIVAITAQTASDIVKSVVNLAGVVDADAFAAGKDGGTILVASNGDLNLTGSMHADGGIDGRGGNVSTWADGTNNFAAGATIAARGGATAGDGGTIEVSGKNVKFRGLADASAPHGKAGVLVVDPTNLTIHDGSPGASGSADIFETTIEGISQGGTNVDLIADNSILMENLTDDVLQGGSGSITLRTTGNESGVGTITFADKNDTITTTTGNITVDANGSLAHVDIGSLATGVTVSEGTLALVAGIQPGSISVTSSTGNITTHNLTAIGAITGGTNEASVTLAAAQGDVKVDGDILVALASTNPASEGSVPSSADAALTISAGSVGTSAGPGNIEVTGRIGVFAFASNATDDIPNAQAYAGAELRAHGNVSLNSGPGTGEYKIGDSVHGTSIGTADLLSAAGLPSAGTPDDISLPSAPPAIAIGAAARDTQEVGGPNVSGAHGAYAESYLTVTAGDYEGSGNLTINGPTLVVADARVFGDGEYTGPEGFGKGNSRILGDAEANASANLTANIGSSEASGNVTIGDFTVTSVADVILTGNVTLDGLNEFSPNPFYDGIIGGARSYAGANITANGGTVTAGDIAVTADAHVKLDGNITISNIGVFGSDSYTAVSNDPAVGGAYAESDLNVSADHAVNLGGVAVTANATSEVGDVTISGINVGTWYEGSVSFTAFDDGLVGPTEAYAGGSIGAGNDITVTGDTVVTANALSQAGNITMSAITTTASGYYVNAEFTGFRGFRDGAIGYSEASASLNVTSEGGGVSMTGVTVTADATSRAGDITMNDVFVYSSGWDYSSGANAQVIGFKGDVIGGADANANLSINAYGGGVSATGAVTVAANATTEVGNVTIGENPTGIGVSFFENSFDIIGVEGAGIGVVAFNGNSRFTGVDCGNLLDGAGAYASLNVYANEVNITLGKSGSGVTVAANATTQAGDITVAGFAVAGGSSGYDNVNASLVGFGQALVSDDVYAQSNANITGYGGNVDLPGGIAVTSNASLAVGNVAINGAAVALASSSGYNSYVNAYFAGVDDDLLNPSYVGADANLNVYAPDGTLTAGGDVTVDGNASITVKNVSIGRLTVNVETSGGSGNSGSFGGVFVENGTQLTLGAAAFSSAAGSYGSANAEVRGINGAVIGTYSEGVSANANLNLYGGSGIAITGNVNVGAHALASVGDINVDGSAYASASGFGYGGYGGYGARAEATFQGIDGDVIDAYVGAQASSYISAGYGGVSVTGNVNTIGEAAAKVGDIDIKGVALAFGGYGGYASAETFGIDGDVLDVYVSASGYGSIYSSIGDIAVGGNVAVNGNATAQVGDITIDVTARTDSSSGSSHAQSVGIEDTVVDLSDGIYSNALLQISASGYGGGSNVTIGGNATANANTLVAVGNIDVTGEATVDFFDPAYAYGVVGNVIYADSTISAGAYGGIFGYDVAINGDTGANASAIVQVGNLSANGSASTPELIPSAGINELSIGPYAEFIGFGADADGLVEVYGYLQAYATAFITANNNMTLGSFNTSGNAKLIVGNMTGNATTSGNGFALGFEEAYIAAYGIGAGAYGGALAYGNLTINSGASAIANAIAQIGSFNDTTNGESNGTAYLDAAAYAESMLTLQAGGYFTFGEDEGGASVQGGDLFVTGDIKSEALAKLDVGSNVDVGEDGEQVFDEYSSAYLLMSAHDSYGGGSGLGKLTNLYNSAAPHALADTGHNGSKLTQVTQADLDATEAADGVSPFYFEDDPPDSVAAAHWHNTDSFICSIGGTCAGAEAVNAVINPPLPIAPTNGLDQRLASNLTTQPAPVITVTPPPALGVLPGQEGFASCVIGAGGIEAAFGQGGCVNVVNFPASKDLVEK